MSTANQHIAARVLADLGPLVDQFAGATILISGGAGFLGRHFVNFFAELNRSTLKTPCRVIALDNFITGSRSGWGHNASSHVEFVWSDITYPLPKITDLSYIIHLAGVASPVYYMKYPIETIEAAVHGTKNLLDLARTNHSLKGFLFFSSSEIYGNPDPRFVPTPETYHGYVSSTGPRACYDESKRLGETISVVYHEKYDIPVTIVRPFNVFGPGMGHNDRRVVPMFTYQSLNHIPITVHSDGHQTRTFCYVSDAISGFIRALLLGTRGDAYNIGNADDEITISQLASLFIELEPSVTIRHIDYPKSYPAGEPQRRCPDLTKAQVELGYRHSIGLKEGLRSFYEWASTNPLYVAAPG
jgi:UDP-glucuronate decarboxylase